MNFTFRRTYLSMWNHWLGLLISLFLMARSGLLTSIVDNYFVLGALYDPLDALFYFGGIVWAGWSICSLFICRLYSKYTVYDDRIEARHGILRRRTSTANLAHIRSMDIDKSLAGMILGYGNVLFGTAGTGETNVIFEGISNPEDVKEKIRAMRNPQGSEQPAHGHQQPMQQPVNPAHGNQQPMQQPVHLAHGHQQPMHEPQQPVHPTHGHQQPMHEPQQPVHPTHGHQQPVHPTHGHQQPMHEPQQPVQPMYEQQRDNELDAYANPIAGERPHNQGQNYKAAGALSNSLLAPELKKDKALSSYDSESLNAEIDRRIAPYVKDESID